MEHFLYVVSWNRVDIETYSLGLQKVMVTQTWFLTIFHFGHFIRKHIHGHHPTQYPENPKNTEYPENMEYPKYPENLEYMYLSGKPVIPGKAWIPVWITQKTRNTYVPWKPRIPALKTDSRFYGFLGFPGIPGSLGFLDSFPGFPCLYHTLSYTILVIYIATAVTMLGPAQIYCEKLTDIFVRFLMG